MANAVSVRESLGRSLLLFLAALLPSALVAIFRYDWSLPPFEDAAMLMRYAGHFAEGHGIVWNPGDPPVDGATDFLFMVLVAGVHKLGFSLPDAVRLLSTLAHVATLWLVFRINVRRHRTGVGIALASVAYLSLGPGLVYLESYFGTPVFALAGLLTYRSFLWLLQRDRPSDALQFAIWGLVTGLIRPEGVLLAGAMLVTLFVAKGGKAFRPIVLAFGMVFGVLGGAYFIWHWWYFGHPLPNPFYIKGGGAIYVSSLRAAVINTMLLALPLLPLFLYGMWKQRMRPRVIILLAPVVGFVVVWILMSNAMNYAMRFQYILLPILMVAWTPILQDLLRNYPQRAWLRVAGSVLVVAALTYQYLRYHDAARMFPDGRVELATTLAPFAGKGYTMAVTEAGNLPLFSQWRAVDTWGLNDREIAHAGSVTTEYLDRYRPEMIVVHDYWAPGYEKRIQEPKWARMTDTLETYVAARGYKLVACYGADPHNTHFYYLLPDFPDFARIRTLIRNLPYPWYENGRPAVNFVPK